MLVIAKTHKGRVRTVNEDFYYVSEGFTNMQLCILADGMGGYSGGEVASSLATISAKEYIFDHFNKMKNSKEELQELIRKSMEYSNQIVYKRAQQETSIGQMGTTLEICLIYDNRVYIGHIGDSRIYRIRQNIMRRLTTDHSYVQKLVKDGTITKEEAYNHEDKHMLMKALGCEENIEPDIMVKGFQSNDIIMMCSDGLYNMISEKELFKVITANTKLAPEKLIRKANELGGYDNISVILVENI